MKILPPTLRESKRYLAFSLASEDEISRRELIYELNNAATALVGDVGSSELGMRLLAFDECSGIMQCAANKVWEVRGIMASVSSVKGVRVRIKVLGVSGTVRATTQNYLLIKDIKQVEPERERTAELEECEFFIANLAISGKIIRRVNNEMDILPDTSHYEETLNNSDTRYFGITVFDLTYKEIE
ncbi:MAG: Rpp14/Pop5 family protein [Methanosarcinales archaeon]|nr:Rpp14/Pop5 family protein [Methanosarcinales archaeon]